MAATNVVTVGCIKMRPTHEDLSHRMTGYVDPTKEACAALGRESFPALSRFGGRIVWRGRFELMLIGPRDATWDACFIAEYPSAAAFVEMLRDPGYRVAVKHRQAACAGFATCPPDALRGGYRLLCAMKRQSSYAAAARGWSVSSGLMSAEA